MMKKRILTFLFTLTAVVALHAAAPYYIFYFIGDGMGHGQVMSAASARSARGDSALTMMTFPVASLATTYSASSPVTDSAAAGTALASGRKTANGMLGVNSDTVAAGSLAARLQQLGYGVGLVTSVAIDDATPGAFYAHVPQRGQYYDIGIQAARSGYEFLAGAGLRGLRDKSGRPTDLLPELARNGYDVVRGLDALAASGSRKIMLLSTDTLSHNSIGYAIEASEGAMRLPDMTGAALAHLGKVSPDQFFMMVEGGAIDHAGHANDAATVIADVEEFDKALQRAVDFYKAHPDETLIVVTADHETGGMTVGNTASGYMARMGLLSAQKMSKDKMAEMIKNMLRQRRVYGWDDIRSMLAENLGLWSAIPVSEEQEKALEEAYRKVFVDRDAEDTETLYARFDPLTMKAFEIIDATIGAGWTSVHHTGNPVPVFALGVGAQEFSAMRDNTDIPKTILRIVETYRDPSPMMRDPKIGNKH